MTGPVAPAEAWSHLASSARLGLESVPRLTEHQRLSNGTHITSFFAGLGLDPGDPQIRLAMWGTLEVCLDALAMTVRADPSIPGDVIGAMGHPLRVVAASLADQLPHEAVEAVAARRAR